MAECEYFKTKRKVYKHTGQAKLRGKMKNV